MKYSPSYLTEIKQGLSKKKIYRNSNKKINKIYIDYSNEKNEFNNFLKVYEILKEINISIPKIYEVHFKTNLIIMQDFGDEVFHKILNEKNIYYFLKIAVDNLIIIHNSLIQSDLVKLKKYSLIDLQNEISEFIDYYVPFKKIINFDPDEFLNCWNDIFLEENFEFTNFVHKDYEHINLIYLNKNAKHLSCGIIDFQSAYLGFIGWDLFSILEYSRLNFSNKFNEELIKYFYDNINIKIEYKVFRNQYYILNLARQTRLLGRWVKLYNSNHKKEYLNFIDTTKERIILSLNNIQNNKKLKKIYKKCSLTHD